MQPPTHYPETVDGMAAHLLGRLQGVVPDFELRLKAEIAVEVNRLKRVRNAVILGHNYMEPALFHSITDYTGDSLYLSRVAASSHADIIVFCGVRFMAETAKLLNPTRTVLLPSPKGGCSLAESITGEEVRALRALCPGVPVVSYVNTYADVKAETDICCTSGNAVAVVRHLMAEGHERIIFLPDEYLAQNVARETGLPILFPAKGPDGLHKDEDPPNMTRVMIGWRGRCEVHEKFTVEDITRVRQQFPDVVVLAHPECSPEVVQAADFSGSTTAMIERVQQLTSGRYLLLTECSMADNIVSHSPNREMLRLCSIRCPHMAEITLEQTLESLRSLRYAVDVAEPLRERARQSLERMISIG